MSDKKFDDKGRGSFWKNDRKDTDKHPDWTGSFTDLNGLEYWLSGWTRKQGANPKAPLLSFTIKPKEVKGAAAKPMTREDRNDDMADDEIPF